VDNPRTPGAGVTGALETLGGEISRAFVSGPGSSFDGPRFSPADLDREADFLDASGMAMRDDKAKIQYVPILEWSDRETAKRFSSAVIELIRQQYPDALASAA
jgi:hypothetical protein